jgi:hypothetical protein
MARHSQPSMWSLTSPIACMNAYTVVGPTKRQPRRLRSFDSATDAADCDGGGAVPPGVSDSKVQT